MIDDLVRLIKLGIISIDDIVDATVKAEVQVLVNA
jgi:hypothetical protein